MQDSHRKKIILIGPAYPYRGGNSLFVSYVFDALKDAFEVKIFNYKLLYPKFLFPGTTQFDKSSTLIKKAPNERLINSISPFNWLKTAWRIKKENADLVVFDWWHPFFGTCHFTISRLIKKKYKNKILFITENFISHEGNPVDKILTSLGLKNAASFLALSAQVENDLKTISRRRKIYRSELPVYDCYDFNSGTDARTVRKKLGYSDDDFILLFFGYVRKYKGLDLLIEAFPQIKKSHASAKLLIVGEFYDDPNIYLEQIKQLGIEDDIKIINQFVPNEDVGQYYTASDLVILPYRSATQSGILNVAYGFLKPVLVTDVGGLAEFVVHKKTGIVVPPNSSDEVSRGVIEYLNLKETENFPLNIQNHRALNFFNKLPDLFHEIIKDSAG